MAVPAAQIIGALIGSGASEPIKALGDAISKLYTTDDERLSKQALLDRIAQNLPLAQAEINKTEAVNPNWFTSGWRPAVGWVCAASLGCFFIPQFVIGSYLWAKLSLLNNHIAPYPISAADLIALVTTLLGSSIIRTIDKIAKVAK